MGNYCCNCGMFGATPVQRKIILLLVGLDNSGKTTAAKGLAGEVVEQSIPTIGFSSIKMKHKGFDVIIYDLGGGPQIRGIWSCYFNDVYGVIFVVDASDENRLEEAKVLLYNLLTHEKLAGKPLLVLANKQDVPNAMDEIDIVESLRLEPLVNRQKCLTLVEVCSALKPGENEKVDTRLVRGYRWLVRQVINNYEELNDRVDKDMQEAQASVLAQREEWKRKKKLSESPNVSTSRNNSGRPTDKSTSPDKERNGFAHSSPKFSQRIKTQVQMAERQKIGKLNQVHPKNKKEEMTLVKASVANEEHSMIVKALTSPRNAFRVENNCAQTRPHTSKSLKCRRVNPWKLDEDLTPIDRQITVHHPPDIEYFSSQPATS